MCTRFQAGAGVNSGDFRNSCSFRYPLLAESKTLVMLIIPVKQGAPFRPLPAPTGSITEGWHLRAAFAGRSGSLPTIGKWGRNSALADRC
jgi:hypothetical protein